MNQPRPVHTSSWQPSPDIKCHDGSPPTADADFFMPPPQTIGELISVNTTLKTSTPNPMPESVRWMLVILAGSASLLIILMFLHNAFWALLAAGVNGWLTWFCTRFYYTCSYVGTDGLISYELVKSRSAMPKENLLLFTDAHSLYTQTTRNYTNGVYTGTSYTYTWRKNSGNQHVITGSYHGEKTAPKAGDNWYFANIAESVWSSYLLSNLDRELEQNGYVEFPIGGALQAVRVGNGFMEFVTKKDGAQRVMVSEMHDITLGSGTFQFKHQDAKWWSGKGKYSFEYANIPNARVFLICLKELVGISWD